MSHEQPLRLYIPNLSAYNGWKWVIGLCVFAGVVRGVVSCFMKKRRLAKLGGAPGRIISAKVPFGM